MNTIIQARLLELWSGSLKLQEGHHTTDAASLSKLYSEVNIHVSGVDAFGHPIQLNGTRNHLESQDELIALDERGG